MWSADIKKLPEGIPQRTAPPQGETILGIVSRLTKMATEQPCKDIKLLKNTKITVFVDEALPDILVVTYEFGVKIFKGVLLDSTKRNLPCGIPNLNPAFDIPAKTAKEDPLYAVNQRFAYTEPGAAKKRNVQISSKYKNSRMTVRLRPRQVLCSKCKGICNENSENVSRKRKFSDKVEVSPPPAQPVKRGLNAPVTRSTNVLAAVRKPPRDRGGGQQQSQQSTMTPSLVPYLTRLTGVVSPLADAPDGSTMGNSRTADSSSSKRLSTGCQPQQQQQENGHESDQSRTNNQSEEQSSDGADLDRDAPPEVTSPPPAKLKRMFRKKRSASSTEERWQEANRPSTTVPSATISDPPPPAPSIISTRTIKISYGPQGEGTVLKIPAESLEDDSEENVDIHDGGKAARKALKRARKEARKRIMLGTTSGGTSPRCKAGGLSPRYTVGSASPRHGLGNNSPRYMYEINMPRKRKHKMKHKKKHREDKDRKHKEGEVSSTQDDSKEQCITQKLSINLRRLNNTYAPCQPDKADEVSSSDEHGETVPDFPQANPPLMLRINAQTVTSAVGADGVRLLVGDVVWGKIRGFPWWPGKILTMTNSSNQGPQAHVAWYGSSTSSLMQCDQLSHYLDNFKFLYNRKKKGPYKEAVKQATMEARENAENRVRQPLGNSPSHNIIQVVPPALASPREIDVVS